MTTPATETRQAVVTFEAPPGEWSPVAIGPVTVSRDQRIRDALRDYLDAYRITSDFRGDDDECNRLVGVERDCQVHLHHLLDGPQPYGVHLLILDGRPLLIGWTEVDGAGHVVYVRPLGAVRVVGNPPSLLVPKGVAG